MTSAFVRRVTRRALTSAAVAVSAAAVCVSASAQSAGSGADTTPPYTPKSCATEAGNLFVWNGDQLAAARARLQSGDTALRPALDKLISEADAALPKGPWSVRDKTKTPPSGDKADYYSIGPYWWPDPKKDDGLPYIRRDGETNPERSTDAFDSRAMSRMSQSVQALSLADYFTGNDRYGRRAATLIRHWFINPDTAMNPNLNFAQSIPGRTDGRGIGIIDTYRLVGVVESFGLLESGGHLSADEMQALRNWFANYSLWMLRSDNGKEERLALNNHGIYYDAQLAAFAAFSGDMSAVDAIVNGVESRRIPGQIDKRGRLPRELKRTRPFHYTAFTIQGLMDIATIAECADRDVWTFQTKKGAGLQAASAFHAGYANKTGSWPYTEIRKLKTNGLFDNVCRAARVYGDETHRAAVKVLRRDHPDARILLLTNGCSPD